LSQYAVRAVQAQFRQQRSHKLFRGARVMNFQVKGAEMTALMTEGDVNVKTLSGGLGHG
jgi:hypothetical protein